MGMVFGKTGVAEPAYEVILSRMAPVVNTSYEIRKYPARFAIETEYEEEGEMGKAFMRLAGFIGVGSSPQNIGATSIAMTSPVVTKKGGEDGSVGESIAMTSPVVTATNGATANAACSRKRTMQFILPAEYDKFDSIPKPLNSAVSVLELPSTVGVIHQFSGWVKEKRADERVSALLGQLKKDGMSLDEKEVREKYLLWQYNPPFTIPTFRRNEVWIELNQQQINDHLKRVASNTEKTQPS